MIDRTWIEHKATRMPRGLDPETIVRVRFRNGGESKKADKAGNWNWSGFGFEAHYDVVAYSFEGKTA